MLSGVSLRLRLIDLSWRMYFIDQKARHGCATLLFIYFFIPWSNETSCPKCSIYSVTYCISVLSNTILSDTDRKMTFEAECEIRLVSKLQIYP